MAKKFKKTFPVYEHQVLCFDKETSTNVLHVLSRPRKMSEKQLAKDLAKMKLVLLELQTVERKTVVYECDKEAFMSIATKL